jgi:hypothetical protein
VRVHEPFLEERIKKAEQQAKKIMSGQMDDEDSLVLLYRFLLSQRYHIGIFDEYFQNRTIDELALEVHLWREHDRRNDPAVAQQEAMERYQQEVQKNEGSMFESKEEWQELDTSFLEKAKVDFADMSNKLGGNSE